MRYGVFYEPVENVLGLQTFCPLSDDGPSGLCLRTQNGVNVRFSSQLKKLLSRFRQTVAVFLDESCSIFVAVVRYEADFLVFYSQYAGVVPRHHVSITSDVALVRMVLIPQTYIFSGSYKLSSPHGFRT